MVDTDSDDEATFFTRLTRGGGTPPPDDSEEPLPPQEPYRIGTAVAFSFESSPEPIKHRTISIHEDSSAGCGGKTWEAANVLSDHLVYRWSKEGRNFLKGMKVLELGAGTGVVGILAAMLMCADHPDLDRKHDETGNGVDGKDDNGVVVITDMLFLDLMQKNVELNLTEKEQSHAKVAELTWGTPIAEPIKLNYDYILASDCVYLESAFDPLINTLLEVCNQDTQVFIVSKKRRKADKRFFDKLKKVFNVTEVKDDPHYADYSRQGLSILIATKKMRAA
ncbi:hypothetical protein HDU76_012915 [Blyttiomyces sp. JEL0837]|nr:hypothetical protein HDU76_012915 [Blyttiomyces sp. JEL0837]